MTAAKMKPVIVGITGASGAVMARAAVDALFRLDIPTLAPRCHAPYLPRPVGLGVARWGLGGGADWGAAAMARMAFRGRALGPPGAVRRPAQRRMNLPVAPAPESVRVAWVGRIGTVKRLEW